MNKEDKTAPMQTADTMQNRGTFSVTAADIAAYTEGIATPAQARRVLFGAITNPAIARDIRLLRDADAAPEMTASPDFMERARRLQEAMLQTVRDMTAPARSLLPDRGALAVTQKDEIAADTVPTLDGVPWWNVSNELLDQIRRQFEAVGRTLSLEVQSLSLPCFMPAAAGFAADLTVLRQQIKVDGVHVEFQQLPGADGRVRIIVDSSRLAPVSLTEPTAYRTAFVTLEERVGSQFDRHILVVRLADEGMGYTDFVLGAPEGGLPPLRGSCHVVGITLSHNGDWEPLR